MTPADLQVLRAVIREENSARPSPQTQPHWVSWAKGLAAAVVVAGAVLAAAGVLFVTRADADQAHTTILKDHDADITPIVETLHDVATDSKLLGQRLGQTEQQVKELRDSILRRRRDDK